MLEIIKNFTRASICLAASIMIASQAAGVTETHFFPMTVGAIDGIWTTDLDAGKALAHANGTPLIVYVGNTADCSFCRRAEENVLQKQQWIDFARDSGLVLVYLDKSDPRYMQHLGSNTMFPVFSVYLCPTPTIITVKGRFLYRPDRVINGITVVQSPNNFIQILNSFLDTPITALPFSVQDDADLAGDDIAGSATLLDAQIDQKITLKHTLNGADTNDWFRIPTVAGAKYRLQSVGVRALGASPVISVFRDNPAGVPVHESFLTDTNIIELVATGSGNFFVRVSRPPAPGVDITYWLYYQHYIAPPVVEGPNDAYVASGQTATFKVDVDGEGPFTYQWYRGTTKITGAKSDTYSVVLKPTLIGVGYKCLVSNAGGSTYSRSGILNTVGTAKLKVNIAPAGVVADGAKWSIDNGVTWFDSGTTQTLPTDTYTIKFKEVPGWGEPEDIKDVSLSTAYETSPLVLSATYATDVISLNPNNLVLSSNQQDVVINVIATASLGWTAVPSEPWINIVGVGSGTGNGSFTVHVDNLSASVSRTGTVAVGVATLKITQNPSIQVSFDPQGGTVVPTAMEGVPGVATALPTPTRPGYNFGGWWTGTNGTGVQAVSPYVLPTGNLTLFAKWTIIPAGPTLSVTPDDHNVGKTAEIVLFDVANIGSGSFAWTATVVSGGSWAKITSGKSGNNSGTIKVSVSANDPNGPERTATIRVTGVGAAHSPFDVTINQAGNPLVTTTVTFDPQGGVVTPLSKAVSSGLAYGALPIPTRDDHTFAGWWTAAVGGTPVTATTIVTSETPHTIYAHWTESINAMVGFATAIDLPAEFAGASGIKVAKQPTGLKLNTSTKRLEGIPTKAGLFNTTVSATGIPAQNLVIVVEALPAWAIGTFDGSVKIEPVDTMVATATMTVSAAGKISGKFKLGAKSYSFTAPSFKEKVSDDVYSAETIIKVGKDTINMDLQITRAASVDPAAFATLGTAEGGFEQEGEEYSLRLSRNIWKDAGATALLDPFVGYYTAAVLPDAGDTYGSGYLTFTIDKKGSVKTAGKLADGTSVSLSSILMGVDTNLTYTLLHVTPSGYKGGWFSGMIPFEIIDAEPVILTSVADAWCSLNPQATGEYEEGFLRDADIAGGWYDKLINLRAYFEDGVEVGGIVLPELLAAVKTTDWNPDNPSKKITTTANELINAMEDASPVGLILGLTPATGNATGFVAPANDAPTKLPDGSYDYTVDKNGDGQSNTSGLTYKFTRATGLFSGKFSIWYDYVSAQDLTTDKETLKHESKSASFQGVITPTATDGTAGRGYYLWADQSEYDTGKTDKNGNPVMKSYKYNNSFDFLLLVP